jgi:glucose-6-phosphate isomerase
MSRPWILKCTDVPQYDALQAAAEEFQVDDKLHLRNLCNDSSRCAGLTAVHTSERGSRKVILDYSRQQVTGETMELLFDLADAVGFTDRREAFRAGERINTTEDRAALHHVLRMPKDYMFSPGSVTPPHCLAAGTTILDDVHRVKQRVQEFTHMVRSGQHVGVTGQSLIHTLVIGTEGVNLGTEFVHEALANDEEGEATAQGRTLHFLSNVDPVDVYLNTKCIDPERTLVIVISKTLQTGETMLNARSIKDWLVKNLATATVTSSSSSSMANSTANNSHTYQNRGAAPAVAAAQTMFAAAANPADHGGGRTSSTTNNGAATTKGITEQQVMAAHVVAVSCNVAQCQNFGIPRNNVFGIWDWIVGRYAVCSAVGLLPLSLQYSYRVMDSFLRGAHDVDEHFFHAPLRDNIPVLLGLLGVWNSTFMGYPARAILPYAQSLKRFPAYVQQVDMESNGKRVALDGVALSHASGEINFGEPGTNSHHSFFQLMHQGRVVPADFVGFMESQRPIDLPGEAVSSHDEFMSNFFAQPDALAYGKTLVDLIQEGVPDGLREHMVFTGNRPSSSILMTRLDAFAVGQLLALYEHRTAVQGFLWGINSFDQHGIELGKLLAKHVRAQLSASRRTGASVQGFNLSTSSLLEAYLAHGKQKS